MIAEEDSQKIFAKFGEFSGSENEWELGIENYAGNRQSFKFLKDYPDWIWSIAMSPDAENLVIGSDAKTLQLWNINTGVCIKTLKAERLYEGMNITGVTGITNDRKATLKVLGAVENIE